MPTKETIKSEVAKLHLTELETEVLELMIFFYPDVDIDEIRYETKRSTKVIRGALSSLVKKGIIQIIDEGDGNFYSFTDKYEYLDIL